MIERTLEDGILTLRLAHGKASAMDIELLQALVAELHAATDGCRAVILTGTGSIFSAGVDLIRLTEGGATYVQRFLPLLTEFVEALFAFPRPLVAAANGHAIAGGCVMVLAADYRLFATGSGRIGVPELLVGVPFPAAPLEVVRFAVPPNRLQSLVYTGRTLLPDEALAWGLVDELVAPDGLAARAREVARQLAALPEAPFRLTKKALRKDALRRIAELRREPEEGEALRIWSEPDTRQRIRDYLSRTLRK